MMIMMMKVMMMMGQREMGGQNFNIITLYSLCLFVLPMPSGEIKLLLL